MQGQELYYCPEISSLGNHIYGYENCYFCKGQVNYGIPVLNSERLNNDKKLKNSSKEFHFSSVKQPPAQTFQPPNMFAPNQENDEPFNDYEYEPCEEGEIILQLMERFKNCTCCKGEIYNCKGVTCKILGVCYCYLHEELEEDNAS